MKSHHDSVQTEFPQSLYFGAIPTPIAIAFQRARLTDYPC